MRAIIVPLLFAGACTGSSASVHGVIEGTSFTAIDATFTHNTVTDPGTGNTETTTILAITDVSLGCASTQEYPRSTVDVTVNFGFVFPLPAGASNHVVTTPGGYTVGTTDAMSAGLYGPASASWLLTTDHDGGQFTGGTVVITAVSDTELDGEIDATSDAGDLASGSFHAARCPDVSD